MMYWLIFELLLLYFFSRWVTRSLFTLFLLIFRSRTVTISIMLVLQFPGTVIHELAHLFTAEILRVPTGKLTLVPEMIRDPSTHSKDSGHASLGISIRSGSVAIAETDPFRRYAIGLAPIFAGMLTITAIAYVLPGTANWGDLGNWGYWGLLYLLFAISNSMFSSPEDMKGFWPFAIAIGTFTVAGYYYGLRMELTGQALEIAATILTTLTQSLGIVLLVNAVLLVVSWGLTRLIYSLLRR